ncbi:hypothetical protein ACOSQ3_005690 [Xanthoceras sorbifolium]
MFIRENSKTLFVTHLSLSSFSLSLIEILKLDRFTMEDRFGAIKLRRRSLDIIEHEWF